MVQPTYPGVYIQEVPSGVHPIASVATSVGAFIDYFAEGPVNEAREIFGIGDFSRTFGGIDKRSEASYAIAQFFLNGGSRAYVVRVIEEGNSTPAQNAAQAIVVVLDSVGGADVMTVTAKSHGDWGNTVRVRIDPTDDATTFKLTVTRYASLQATAAATVTEPPYPNLSADPTSGRYFAEVINESSNLVSVQHDSNALSNKSAPAVNGTVSALKALSAATIQGLNGKKFTVDVRKPTGAGTDPVSGSHTATLKVPSSTTTMRQLRQHLESAIRDADDGSENTHKSLKGATVAVLYDEATNKYRYLVRSDPRAEDYTPDQIVQITGPNATTIGFDTANGIQNVQEYVLGDAAAFAKGAQKASNTKGSDGLMPDPTRPKEQAADAPRIAQALTGDEATKKGLYALEDADIFNILCLPVAAKLPENQMTSVITEALTYCERKRAFMIIDIPQEINKVQEMKDWIELNAGLRHKNAAVYFPRVKIADEKNEYRPRSFGASGTVAGIYARTDSTRGVWKAPAGLESKLSGVSKLEYQLTDPENGTLNPIAVNCLRVFDIHGRIVWGARTLEGADEAASEWKYIPIRRLALMLEESLFRATKWVVFMPNDEPTWAKVRQNVGAFMMNLFRQGAFQGSTPDKAFYVKCDSETTTANDRNLGIVNIEVGFAPLKPAEFVVIKIQQMPDVE